MKSIILYQSMSNLNQPFSQYVFPKYHIILALSNCFVRQDGAQTKERTPGTVLHLTDLQPATLRRRYERSRGYCRGFAGGAMCPERSERRSERSVGPTSPRSGARSAGWVLGAGSFWAYFKKSPKPWMAEAIHHCK